MYEFVSENLTTILIVAAVVAIVLIILCIVAKLFKIAIGLCILSVVVPIIFTIFWGDGGRYVSTFESFFQPAYQQRIEDIYDYYKQKDSEDPFVNYDAVSNTVTDIFQHAFETVPQPSLQPDNIQDILDKYKPSASP